MVGLPASISRRLLRVALMAFCFFVSSAVHASMEEIRLRLVWKNQFQFAGYYVAREKGFYAQEGLDVKILEKQHGIDNAAELLAGKTHFSVGRSSVLINRARGDDVVALLAAFQHSPMMLMTMGDSGISAPESLRGKRIMFTQEAKFVSEVLAMLIQAGIAKDDYVHLKHTFNLQDLVDGKTDAMAAYISNEPFQLTKKGIKYNIIHPKNYGFSMYSDILFTSGKMIRERPEVVNKFYHATMRGWAYAFDNIDEAVSIIHEKYNTQKKTREALKFEAKALKQIAFDKDGEFGTITQERLQQMLQIYLLTNIVDKNISLDGFVYRDPIRKFYISSQELQYLSSKPFISVCVDQEWMPYEGFEAGVYRGIVADYMQLIQDRLDTVFYPVVTQSVVEANQYIKSGKCEIISSLLPTAKSSRLYNLTRHYLSVPAVVAKRTGYRLDGDLPKSVSVLKDTAFEEIIDTRYPNVKKVMVNDGRKGMEMVEQGEVDGFLCARSHVNSMISRYGFRNIEVSESFQDVIDVSIAVNKSDLMLLGLLDKAIQSITPEERQQITDRWININPPSTISSDFVMKLLLGVGLILFLAIYRYVVIWKSNKKLARMAGTDWLTKLPNRHKIINSLGKFISHSNRYSRSVSVIYFDIDDFKSINDRFGHDAGDKVLQKLAHLVKNETRKTDVSGRWGGEEFILVSPEATEKESVLLADKLRRIVEDTDFGLPVNLTCSFGVAQYQNDEPLESLINRADEALYRAKNNGKNQVIAYESG